MSVCTQWRYAYTQYVTDISDCESLRKNHRHELSSKTFKMFPVYVRDGGSVGIEGLLVKSADTHTNCNWTGTNNTQSQMHIYKYAETCTQTDIRSVKPNMRHLRCSWLKRALQKYAASIHWVVIKNFARNRKTAARQERDENGRLWVE